MPALTVALLFGASSALANPTLRQVRLLDFGVPASSAEVPPSKSPQALAEIEPAMLAGFAGMAEVARRPVLYNWAVPVAEPGSSERSFVRVPQWMRSGRAPVAAMVAAAGVPAIGNCAPRAYRPTGRMSRIAEKRRELLYPVVQRVACEAGLPIGLFDAMLIQESGYDPFISSPKGAFGLGQLMPDTARQLGVNRYDLYGNLSGAARYLSGNLREFGRYDLALAAYNAGPKRVRDLLHCPWSDF